MGLLSTSRQGQLDEEKTIKAIKDAGYWYTKQIHFRLPILGEDDQEIITLPDGRTRTLTHGNVVAVINVSACNPLGFPIYGNYMENIMKAYEPIGDHKIIGKEATLWRTREPFRMLVADYNYNQQSPWKADAHNPTVEYKKNFDFLRLGLNAEDNNKLIVYKLHGIEFAYCTPA